MQYKLYRQHFGTLFRLRGYKYNVLVAADILSAACSSGISNPHLQYGRLQISRNRKAQVQGECFLFYFYY